MEGFRILRLFEVFSIPTTGLRYLEGSSVIIPSLLCKKKRTNNSPFPFSMIIKQQPWRSRSWDENWNPYWAFLTLKCLEKARLIGREIRGGGIPAERGVVDASTPRGMLRAPDYRCEMWESAMKRNIDVMQNPSRFRMVLVMRGSAFFFSFHLVAYR